MAASKTKTVVVTDYTDPAGKRWKAGQDFTGTAEEKQAAIDAGQVQEQPADPNAE